MACLCAFAASLLLYIPKLRILIVPNIYGRQMINKGSVWALWYEFYGRASHRFKDKSYLVPWLLFTFQIQVAKQQMVHVASSPSNMQARHTLHAPQLEIMELHGALQRIDQMEIIKVMQRVTWDFVKVSSNELIMDLTIINIF